jgi:hypothetical protein
MYRVILHKLKSRIGDFSQCSSTAASFQITIHPDRIPMQEARVQAVMPVRPQMVHELPTARREHVPRHRVVSHPPEKTLQVARGVKVPVSFVRNAGATHQGVDVFVAPPLLPVVELVMCFRGFNPPGSIVFDLGVAGEGLYDGTRVFECDATLWSGRGILTGRIDWVRGGENGEACSDGKY